MADLLMTVSLEGAVMSIGLLAILLILVRMHYAVGSEWRFTPMLMTHRNGVAVPDRQAFVLLGAFYFSTLWGSVLVLKGQMSEWYFAGYMLAFAGSHFGSRYLKVKGGQSNG